ncbi:hypothetical protein [Sandaracinobacteroides saxicola]|uniref:Uncharacterized protein n=1 Tax=Sandaracinobacteroides saxicola TaxID=2759707 RepID=A0A7G5ILY2_9SPHN|nr:hypothetical protein [Sandaracinobacteroides saxicola]QMW24374.1 hypothetical protein H3309_07965 [Sandaracinobacteroides saxicola]
MGFWEAAVIIVALVTIGKVMSGGRWNRQTRRWERYSEHNPYVRQGVVSNPDAVTKADLARINERLATLEKLVTDPARRLSDEIDQLRR